MTELEKRYNEVSHEMVEKFEDCLGYPEDTLVKLFHLGRKIRGLGNDGMETGAETPYEVLEPLMREYVGLADGLEKTRPMPERIYLWPEGKIPQLTEYTENDGSFNHDPDFVPYMYEVLLPEDVTPKGAVILCAGGDHGDCVLQEAYGDLEYFLSRRYQCFILLNRVNKRPWNAQDVGADVARAIRIIRRDAAKYRIDADKVAFAGFSNGGLTGEDCIEYYSGDQKMTDWYPDYEPDELDEYYGAPDAFLCVYGPRYVNGPFKWEGVKYPPTFFAIGREDRALDNFNYVYPQLLEHKVPVEIHTYAAVPHGQAGVRLLGETRYDNFMTWVDLADAFLCDVFGIER